MSSVIVSNSMKYLIMGLGDFFDHDPVKSKKSRGSIIVVKLPEMKEFVEINCAIGGIKKLVID